MNWLITSVLWISYVVALYFSIFLLLVYLDNKRIFKREKSTVTLSRYPLVSIFVPAFNEEKTIKETLLSLQNLDYPRDKLEIIVINDGSKDRTGEVIAKFIKDKPQFQCLTHRNRGKAASLNRALAISNGEFFACLDADSFVHPLTLRKMLAMYERENDLQVAIITPAMKVGNPKTVLQRIQWLEYLVMILFGRITSHLHSIYVAPGPFSVYRTEIIKKIGAFDEQNITEDQEIAYRVQLNQYKIRQCFDGYVYTTAPGKIKPFYRQRRRWYLGSVACLHQYRSMIANKRYGDFGLMQMVKNLLGYFLAVAGIALSWYYIFVPFYQFLQRMNAINFDFITVITNAHWKIIPLNFLLTDFRLVFILILLFMIGFFFFYAAHKSAEEKITKFGWFPIIPYFLAYYLLKGTILLISVAQFSRGKKIRW